jgi:hypothetical protein
MNPSKTRSNAPCVRYELASTLPLEIHPRKRGREDSNLHLRPGRDGRNRTSDSCSQGTCYSVSLHPVGAGCKVGHNRQSPVECLGIEPRSTACKAVVLAVVTSTPFGHHYPHHDAQIMDLHVAGRRATRSCDLVHQEGFEPPTHSV